MKLRYAIIDDAPFIRELAKSILDKEGHICVAEAGDGAKGIEVCLQTLPDFIILDMAMPLKNGLQVAKELKSKAPEIKIIGCSTIDDTETVAKATALGFDSYLSKPFTADLLRKEIRKAFNSQVEAVHE